MSTITRIIPFGKFAVYVEVEEVDRSRSAIDAISATNREISLDNPVVSRMPMGEGDKAEILFINPRLFGLDKNEISADELQGNLDSYGFIFADPISLAAVNEADRHFDIKMGNFTCWRNEDGELCYISFLHHDGDHCVRVTSKKSSFSFSCRHWVACFSTKKWI